MTIFKIIFTLIELKLIVNHSNLKAQVLYNLASQFCRLNAVGDKWIWTNRTIVGGHGPHYALEKIVSFLISNELEEEIQFYSWNIMYECMFTYIWKME